MQPQLSVVIVEYHCIDEIRRCIESLRKYIPLSHELIVSSNSCYSLEQQHEIDLGEDDVRWVFNPRNGGFAYAMNQGLQQAKGRYLAIMNSDCTLETPLDGMIGFMDRHPEVGVTAPQMHDNDGNIQDTARPYVNVPRFVWRHVRRLAGRKISILDRKMDYSLTQTVDWVIGAFMMVSREAYNATGGLDDRFFMYAEDLDWCTRIRDKGMEVVYFPKAILTYKGTRRARSNKKYARIFMRSHMAYWRKFGFFCGYPKRKKLIYNE